MKLLALIFSLSLPFLATAAQYTCESADQKTAMLTIQNQEVQWDDDFNEASSNGTYIGLEQAPFSDLKGYSLFKLEYYYNTDDSYYVLALNKTKGKTLKASTYYENDDHMEEETKYVCTLRQI